MPNHPAAARLAITLVCALSLLQSTIAAGSPYSSPDVTAYAKMYGVSPAEAGRRLDLQVAAAQLEERLSVAAAGTFGGLWIEHQPRFQVFARFVEGGDTIVRTHTSGTALEGRVEAIRGDRTVAELRSQIAELNERLVGLPADLRIDVKAATIEVYVSSRTAFDAFIDERAVIVPGSVRITEVAWLARPTADLYGGLALGGNGCTSGFGVMYSGTGDRGITTAGHCGNSASYSGSSLPFQSEAWGGNHDEQWHLGVGFQVRNWIYDGSSTRQITSKTYRGSQSVGSFVCKYGRTTGYGCGEISSRDSTGCVPSGRPTFIYLRSTNGSDLAASGDSGGPVFLLYSAYGTASCEAGPGYIDSIYTAVDFIENGLGVTVLTAP